MSLGQAVRPTYPLCSIVRKGRAEGFQLLCPGEAWAGQGTLHEETPGSPGAFLVQAAPVMPQIHKMADYCTLAAAASTLFGRWAPSTPEAMQVVRAWLEFHKLGGLGLPEAGLRGRTAHAQSMQLRVTRDSDRKNVGKSCS